MKKLTQILSLFFLATCLTFGSVQAKPSGTKETATTTSDMRLLSGNTVTLGSAVTALFQANKIGEAQILVKTVEGKQVLDQNIDLDKGYNLVKLKVAEIPVGFYVVTLTTEGGTQTMPIIVK